MLEARTSRGLRSLRPIKLGLTGGLASGKSSALAIFARLGWKVLSADEIVAEIYAKEGLSKAHILKRFGKSESGLRKLEKWIHPQVEKAVKQWMKRNKKFSVVVEIPLLYEAGFEKYFDYCLFIFTSQAERKRRALKRGMNSSLFDFLDQRQWSASRKAEISDYILHNKNKNSMKRQIALLSGFFLQR